MRYLAGFLLALVCANAQFGLFRHDDYFEPVNRLAGIGIDRKEISDLVLARRTALMIDSQTFTILRDPRALEGAQRITNPRLWKVFEAAGKESGLPPVLVASVAYLESWGDAKAQSPAGPRGIMQFSQATARANGLKITYATRYRTVMQKRKVKVRGKYVTRDVAQKTPYEVLLSDERLIPERAIPAAAVYLSRMAGKFGGLDLAVFAYHCGEGCVSDFITLARQNSAFKNQLISVPRLFFTANPVNHREIYQKIKENMTRDYSPTYYFRVMRAGQLLELYKSDPTAFENLREEYRNQGDPAKRANSRLAAWLKPADLQYQSCEDLQREEGKSLARVVNKPAFFGFQMRAEGPHSIGEWDLRNRESYQQASPAAIGTLLYISFETRRLFDAMKPKGEKYVPLEVTSLVRSMDHREPAAAGELPMHCTGQVFDIAHDSLPPHEKESLNFILDDMGWDGYLGFVEESGGTLHIGCSPSSREFFTKVYRETIEKKNET